MKILFVITGLVYGGAETQLVGLALRLKARGRKIRVMLLVPPKAFTEEFEAPGQTMSYISKCSMSA